MTATEMRAVNGGGPRRVLGHRQILWVVAGVGSGMFLAGLDHTIVTVALPTIVGDLGGLEQLPWVVTVYILAQTSTIPLWGKLGDLHGRRWLFQVAITGFVVASALIGLSQNMGQLILARAFQGVGAGGIVALTFAILGDLITPRQRGRYHGYLTGLMMVSSVAGPLVGGFIVDSIGWRWVFYVNVPLGALALVITTIALPSSVRRMGPSVPFDYLGGALLIGGTSTLMLVAIWGGDRYAWASPAIVGLAAIGFALLAAFVAQERRAVEPVIPPRVFADPLVAATIVFGFILGIIMFPAMVFIPLFLQVVREVSPTASGLLMLPLMTGLTLAAVVSGRLISRTGRYRLFPVVGTVMLTLGYLLLSLLNRDTTLPQAFVFVGVVGFGLGTVMPTISIAVQNAAPQADLGAATASLQFFRFLGAAFGTAVFGTIFTSRLGSRLTEIVSGSGVGPLDPKELSGSPAAIRALPAEVREGVVEAFASSVHIVFLCAVPVAAVALLISLFLRDRPLRDDFESDEATVVGMAG